MYICIEKEENNMAAAIASVCRIRMTLKEDSWPRFLMSGVFRQDFLVEILAGSNI
jgi:hypothetical protein